MYAKNHENKAFLVHNLAWITLTGMFYFSNTTNLLEVLWQSIQMCYYTYSILLSLVAMDIGTDDEIQGLCMQKKLVM